MKGKVEGFLDPVKEAVQKTESVEAGKERPSESQEQSEKKVVNEKKIENDPKPVIAVEPPKVVAAISNESKPELTESPSNGQIKEAENVEEKEMEVESKAEERPAISLEQSKSSPQTTSEQPEMQSQSPISSPLPEAPLLLENAPESQQLVPMQNPVENLVQNQPLTTENRVDSSDSLPLFLEETASSPLAALQDASSVHSNHSQEISSLDISPVEENHSVGSSTASQVSQEEMEILSQLFSPAETKNRCVIRHNIVFSESDTPSVVSSPTSLKPAATSIQGEEEGGKTEASAKGNETEMEIVESNELQKSLFVASEEEVEEEKEEEKGNEKPANSSALDPLSVSSVRVETSLGKEPLAIQSVGSHGKAEKQEVEEISFDLPMSAEVSYDIPVLTSLPAKVQTDSESVTEVQTVPSKPSEVEAVPAKPTEVESVPTKPSEVDPAPSEPTHVNVTPKNSMDVESSIETPVITDSTLEKAESLQKQTSNTPECSSPAHQPQINPADLITPPRSSLKRPIQVTQDNSSLKESKIVSVAMPRPPEEFVTPQKKKNVATTTVSPTKVVDESEFTTEENPAPEKEAVEDGFPDLSMFSPLGGRRVVQSSRIKRLLRELEGERNRFRSQFQIQIQGLLTSFEEEQSHANAVTIDDFFVMSRSESLPFSSTISRNMFVLCLEFTTRNAFAAVFSFNTIR